MKITALRLVQLFRILLLLIYLGSKFTVCKVKSFYNKSHSQCVNRIIEIHISSSTLCHMYCSSVWNTSTVRDTGIIDRNTDNVGAAEVIRFTTLDLTSAISGELFAKPSSCPPADITCLCRIRQPKNITYLGNKNTELSDYHDYV